MDKNEQFQKALIEALKAERKKSGLSHEKLAAKAGLSRATIGKIESGAINPTMLTVFKITNAMGLSLKEFINTLSI